MKKKYLSTLIGGLFYAVLGLAEEASGVLANIPKTQWPFSESSGDGSTATQGHGLNLNADSLKKINPHLETLFHTDTNRLPYHEPVHYYPRLLLEGGLGNASGGGLDGMIPLLTNENHIFHLDLSGYLSNDSQSLYSAGLGYRQLLPQAEMIWGIYGFGDYGRSSAGEYFPQFNPGFELLSEAIDFRINGYLPLSNDSKMISQTVQGTVSGYTLTQNTYTQTQKLMAGLEAELGTTLVRSYHFPLRIYGGYYHYGFNEGIPNMNGFLARVEQQLTYRFRALMNYQYDNIQRSQWQLGLRVYLGGVSENSDENDRYSRLRSRMMDKIERRSALTTGLKTTIETVAQPQKVYFVDPNAPAQGSGTYENPYNEIGTALTNASSGDWIYAYGGNGRDYAFTQGLTVNDGVSLYGSGSALQFQGVTYLARGEAPVFHFTLPNQAPTAAYGLSLGNNASLAGVTIQAANDNGVGILINGKQQVSVNNITIQGGFSTGLYVNDNSRNISLNELNISEVINDTYNLTPNNARAIIIGKNVDTLSLSNSLLHDNANGILIGESVGGSKTMNIRLSNLQVLRSNARATEQGGNYGIWMFNPVDAQLSNVRVEDASGNGVEIRGVSDSSPVNVLLQNASLNNNGFYGLLIAPPALYDQHQVQLEGVTGSGNGGNCTVYVQGAAKPCVTP